LCFGAAPRRNQSVAFVVERNRFAAGYQRDVVFGDLDIALVYLALGRAVYVGMIIGIVKVAEGVTWRRVDGKV
jgi:hypothetical protein